MTLSVVARWPVPTGYGEFLSREHVVDDVAWMLECQAFILNGSAEEFETWKEHWASEFDRLGYPDEGERLGGLTWAEIVEAAIRLRVEAVEHATERLTGEFSRPDYAEGLRPDPENERRIVLEGLEHRRAGNELDRRHYSKEIGGRRVYVWKGKRLLRALEAEALKCPVPTYRWPLSGRAPEGRPSASITPSSIARMRERIEALLTYPLDELVPALRRGRPRKTDGSRRARLREDLLRVLATLDASETKPSRRLLAVTLGCDEGTISRLRAEARKAHENAAIE